MVKNLKTKVTHHLLCKCGHRRCGWSWSSTRDCHGWYACARGSCVAIPTQHFRLLHSVNVNVAIAGHTFVKPLYRTCTIPTIRNFFTNTNMSTTTSIALLSFPFDSWPQNGIHISNPNDFSKIIAQLIEDGHSHTQIIADFDNTLSAPCSQSSHGVLEISPKLPSSYRNEATELFEHYYPIEMNHALSETVREQAMVEWWNAAHALLHREQLTTEILKESVKYCVEHGEFKFRDQFLDFLGVLKSVEIPLLIFSAGLGNVIQELLLAHNIDIINNNLTTKTNCCDAAHKHVDNVEIVSNWMKFDPDSATLSGFEDDLIHSLNKNYTHVQNQRHRQNTVTASAPHRKNVLLLGDSLTDIRMSHGLDNVHSILRIGYLNKYTPEKLVAYKEIYDVVLTNGDMSFPKRLVEVIVSQSPTPLQMEVTHQQEHSTREVSK